MNPETFTIRSNPLRLLLMQVMALAGMAGGILLAFGQGEIQWIVVGVLFALCAAFVAFSLVKRVPALDLDEEGFTLRVATGSRKYLWKEIDGGFVMIPRGMMQLAGFKLTPEGKARLGKISPPAPGYDAGIGGFYELPMAQIVEMLNEWKRKACAPST